jgi:hypothetical protein
MRGKFSLMGIFSQFMVSDFSKPLPRFRLFAKIGFENEGGHPFTVRLRTGQGQNIFEFRGVANGRQEDEVTSWFVANLNLTFDDLKFPRPGMYELVLAHNEQILHVVPLQVVILKPAMVQ